MNILISNEQESVGFDERLLCVLKSVASYVLDNERAGENIELSVALVEEAEIRNLNKRYRDKDTPTDVLSFVVDSEIGESIDNGKTQPIIPGGGTLSAGQLDSYPKMLGDVIICPSVAMQQAVEYGQTFDQEIKLLLIHGILHLLGYDHIKDSEAEVMENREREILEELSRERSIDTISLNEGTGGNG